MAPHRLRGSTCIVGTAESDLGRVPDDMSIYDLMGRQVLALPAQILEAGAARRVAVDAASLASGTYLYRLTAQTQNTLHVATGRMVLVK